MKKIIVFVATFCLAITLTKAQGFRIGVKAGANGSKISGQSFTDEFKLSYQAGLFMEIDFNKKWGIQPEVLISQSQGSVVNNGTVLVNPNVNTNYSLNYLNIPILLRYKIGKLLVLNAGPQYSILLNNDNTLFANGQNAFKNGDFAMVGGVQLNFNFLRIYARYNIGLNNLNDLNNSENWKSQQIQVGIGLRF